MNDMLGLGGYLNLNFFAKVEIQYINLLKLLLIDIAKAVFSTEEI